MGRPRKGAAPVSTFVDPQFASIVPKCTDVERFKDWLGERGLTSKNACRFCEDCTPEFQKQRIMEGRCENPQVRFRKDEDGMLQGVIYRIDLFTRRGADGVALESVEDTV